MAVLGGIVSVVPPANGKLRFLCAGLFIVLGGSACFLIVKQARQNSKTEAEIQSGIKELTSQAAEVGRLQTSNNELQGRVLDLAQLNTSLARENISSVMGGDSFAWMGVNFQFGYPCPFFNHVGKYTLYEVQVRIADVNRFREKLARKEPLTLSDDINVPLGEMHVNTGGPATGVVLPLSGSAQSFNVFFMARNGRWTEILRLRKVNDHWASAVKVTWQYRVGGPSVTQEPVFEKTDSDYPRNEKGNVDWN